MLIEITANIVQCVLAIAVYRDKSNTLRAEFVRERNQSRTIDFYHWAFRAQKTDYGRFYIRSFVDRDQLAIQRRQLEAQIWGGAVLADGFVNCFLFISANR